MDASEGLTGDVTDTGEPESFMELPDELLLQVFQFLPARDLMCGVAQVCKRWYQLSRDEEAWKYIRLNSSSPFLTRTLAVAPALAALHLYERVDEVFRYVVGPRKPRVRELLVYNDHRQTTEALFALLRGTVGLQSLQIIGEMSTELLQVVDELPLTELDIAPWASAPRFRFQGRGLRSLVVHNSCNQLARDLIDAHRATLRRVLLKRCWEDDTIRALGQCAQLREVRVVFSPALRNLEPLLHLRFLKLEVGEDEHSEDTLRFLASSEMLTRISRCRMYYGDPIKGLLTTVAGRCHRLKSLILSTYLGELPAEHVMELSAFSCLEELIMRNLTVPATLLSDLVDGLMPKLRTLDLCLCDIQRAVVVSLLQRVYPALAYALCYRMDRAEKLRSVFSEKGGRDSPFSHSTSKIGRRESASKHEVLTSQDSVQNSLHKHAL